MRLTFPKTGPNVRTAVECDHHRREVTVIYSVPVNGRVLQNSVTLSPWMAPDYIEHVLNSQLRSMANDAGMALVYGDIR